MGIEYFVLYPCEVRKQTSDENLLNMKIARDRLANHYAKYAQDRGYFLIALDENAKSNLENVVVPNDKNILLVVGGEDSSIGQYILNCADCVVSIKQKGNINSLNASVAAGVAMFSLSKYIK